MWVASVDCMNGRHGYMVCMDGLYGWCVEMVVISGVYGWWMLGSGGCIPQFAYTYELSINVILIHILC